MQDLSPCPNCQCYVRPSETTCPFCEGALDAQSLPAPHTLPRGLSRATAFAVRAALVAGVTSVVACGGEAEDTSSNTQTSGGASTGGGDTATGGELASGGSESSTGGTIGGGGIQAGTGGDLGEGGYTPIPIYGGVFPDPELRAKV